MTTRRSRPWSSRSSATARRPDLHPRLLGHPDQGHRVLNPGNGKRRTPRASSRCTPRTASRSRGHGGQHRRGRRHQGQLHGRHAVRQPTTDHPRAHALPRARHQHVDRAQERPTTSASCRRPWAPSAARTRRFRYTYDDETGQTIISGMGELHLEIIRNKLVRDMKINVEVGKPRVSYREAITKQGRVTSAASSRSRPAVAASSATADHLEPYTAEQAKAEELDFTDSIAFENKVVGGSIPKEFIPSVEYGIRQTCAHGRQVRLPDDQRQGHARRRLVPRRRLVADRLRAGRSPGRHGSHREGRPRPSRADHEGRRDRPQRLPRQHHRRHLVAAAA
jgi:hypothetical protein